MTTREAFKRLTDQFRWMRHARFFGTTFTRKARLKLPREIVVDGKTFPLHYLKDAHEDTYRLVFFENFIEDQYGLTSLGGSVSTIADIGANAGFFTMAAKSYFPGAKIHSYEPNPRVVGVLRRNAANVGAIVFPEAVGREAGFVTMVDDNFSGNARTSISETSPILQVPLSKVLERLGGRVDLLKVDCEGAEWQLLAPEGCLKGVKHLRLEYHLWGGHSLDQLVKLIESHKFKIIHHDPQSDFGVIWGENRAA